MKRTIAAGSRVHVPGAARPCAIGMGYVWRQPTLASGWVFMTDNPRRPQGEPT